MELRPFGRLVAEAKEFREELIWAAGFFDGEGCTTTKPNPSGLRYPVIVIAQVDREVLDRFVSAVGVGKVYGPYSYASYRKNKPVHQYKCCSFEDVQAVIAMLWKWLGTAKRDQARRVLESLKEQRLGA